MAGVINKIRTKGSLLLLIFIGVAMAAFILTDVLSQLNTVFGSGPKDHIGEIQGEQIPVNLFQARVERLKVSAQVQNPQQPPPDQQQLASQAWTEIVNERIYNDQYEKLGLQELADEEVSLLMKEDPQVKEIFGTNDINEIQNIMNQSAQMEDNEQKARMDFQMRQIDDFLYKKWKQDKLKALVENGVFVSTAEARRKWNQEKKKYNVRYLAVTYASIADSTVEITESDYSDMYQKHKEEFRQDAKEARLMYLSQDMIPTRGDSLKAFRYLEDLKADFAAAENDSSFAVFNNRSQQQFPFRFTNSDEFNPKVAEAIAGLPADTVIGPIQVGGSYRLVKINERKVDPVNPFVKLRHILIRPKGNTQQDTMQAFMQAQFQMSQINENNFAQYVQQMSDDQRTKFSGGDLGWYQWGMFGDKFDQKIKATAEGEFVAAQSPMGAHIVHVQQRSPEGVRIAQIGYDIEPSAETIDSLKAILAQFKSQVKDTVTFNALAKKKGLQLKQTDALKPGAYFIGGLQGPNVKSIVVWALTNPTGEIMPEPYMTDNKLVLGYVQYNVEPGYKPLRAVKDQLRERVLNAKKAEIIAAKLEKSGKKDLDAIRNDYGPGAFVNAASDLTYASGYIAGMGQEPRVIGRLFGMKEGELSKTPVKGQSAVYLLKVESVTKPEEPTKEKLEEYRKTQQNQRRSQYANKLEQALRDYAEIKDYRYQFNY